MLTQSLALAGRRLGGGGTTPKDGFFPRVGNMMAGAGWIAMGPGYRHHGYRDRLLFEASGAVSWRAYKLAESRVELSPGPGGRFTVGAQGLWQDIAQANFFGTGSTSQLAFRSEYRLRATDAAVYAETQVHHVAIGARWGVLGRPKISSPVGWHDPGHPDTALVFSDAAAPGLEQQTALLHTDLTVALDTLDHVGYPRRGGLVQLQASFYLDRKDGQFSFRRYELVATRFVPLSSDVWTLALRGSAIVSTTSKDSRVPFYMLPSLGGQNALRGYLDFRFQDRDLVAANVESRWALFPHVDAALFADLGTVSGTVAGLGHAVYKRDAGFGFRMHTRTSTAFRLDVARGDEGWRILLKTSESLKFSTFKRWATVVPVLP